MEAVSPSLSESAGLALEKDVDIVREGKRENRKRESVMTSLYRWTTFLLPFHSYLPLCSPFTITFVLDLD